MNLSLNTKWIFLSFLQQWFKDHPKWTWNADPKLTKIIIADKFSTEIGIAAKRPTIILDRGPIGWTGYFRNEAFPIAKTLNNPANTLRNAYSLTDIIQGSVTLNVTAQTPYEADEIANTVFLILSGYREWFKEKGIFKMFGLSIGQESVVSIHAGGPQLTLVQVRFSFQKQETINLYWKNYSLYVYLNGEVLQEGVDYLVNPGGTGLKIKKPLLENDIVTADYVEAITLDQKTGITLAQSEEDTTEFSPPSPDGFYSYYILNADIVVNIE